MKAPNIYITGNVLYIMIDTNNRDIKPKYVRAAINGYVLGNEIYTQDEILENSPNAKPCKDFLEVNKIYNER